MNSGCIEIYADRIYRLGYLDGTRNKPLPTAEEIHARLTSQELRTPLKRAEIVAFEKVYDQGYADGMLER